MPVEHTLTLPVRNTFLKMIQDVGMDPFEFEWTMRHARGSTPKIPIKAAALVHNPSGLFFMFQASGARFFLEWAPRSSASLQPEIKEVHGNELAILELFAEWIRAVKRNIEAPDLWAELSKGGDLARGDVSTANEPFTKPEQEKLSAEVRLLPGRLKETYQLSDAQMEEVTERVEEVVHAATYLGKHDWLDKFRGAMVSLILSQVIPPDAWAKIWHWLGWTIETWRLSDGG